MKTYRAGIDIGSTTVKVVVLDDVGKIIYGQYRRHCAHTQETLKELLTEARGQLGDCLLNVRITGSGSINLGKALDIAYAGFDYATDPDIIDAYIYQINQITT